MTQPQRIVLASGNPGKIEELQAILKNLPYQIVPQSDFNVPDAAETGLTFIENALIKARNACTLTGLPAIADDSGVCVDALDGQPGIYSARYAGEGASSAKRNQKLLNALTELPDSKRGAHFHCVIVFMRHAKDPDPLVTTGKWFGKITTEPNGNCGMGYDPIFWVSDYQCTAAEMDPEEKCRVSHRGQALTQLCNALRKSNG